MRRAPVAGVACHLGSVRLAERLDGREDLRGDLPRHPDHPAGDLLGSLLVQGRHDVPIFADVAVPALHAERVIELTHDPDRLVLRERVGEDQQVLPLGRVGAGRGERSGGRGGRRIGREHEEGETGQDEDEWHRDGRCGAHLRRH